MSRVIIADDDGLVRSIVRAALEARGHIVGELSDGTAVGAVVDLKRPNLVILDCSMPKVSGIMALLQIRASVVAFATPVLMLTGRRSDADEWIAWDAKADDYLRKPFDPDELVARAEALIQSESEKKALFGGLYPDTITRPLASGNAR